MTSMGRRHAHVMHDYAGAIRRRAIAPASLLATVGLLALAPAASAVPVLPDLVADAPVPSRAPEIYSDAQGQRLLMRMDGYVHNAGAGALEIRATNNVGGTMTAVSQMLYDRDPAIAPTPATGGLAPRVIFESADGHNHFHLRHAMRYSLWNDARSAEAAPSQKVGFCLVDSEQIEAGPGASPVYRSSTNFFCQQNNPTAQNVLMGVSAGWRDWYSASLSFQWVDISDVAPGRYWLRADADPDGVIAEANEVNSATYATTASVVNGYLAQPVNAGTVGSLSSTNVIFKSLKFDDTWPATPGAVQYKIVTAPTKGTLSQPVGTWFSASQVRYTPRFGQSGTDAFTFAARDGSSAFPRNARTATASVTIKGLFGATPAPTTTQTTQTSRMAISGAPQQTTTSSSVPLTATGPGADRGLRWAVDGSEGGNADVGTISPDGVYRAPATPPSGGRVTITAGNELGDEADTTLRIVPAAAGRPAPSVAAPPVPARGLSRVRLARHKRALIAAVAAGQSGRVRFVATRDGVRIGSCSTAARAGTVAICKMTLPRAVAPQPLLCKLPRTTGLKLPGVRVTATLTSAGRVLDERSARPR
jgi:hypothetical protein